MILVKEDIALLNEGQVKFSILCWRIEERMCYDAGEATGMK